MGNQGQQYLGYLDSKGATPIVRQDGRHYPECSGVPSQSHHAFIALGSNIGNRVGAIEQACREMTERGIQVRTVSSLYETAPMYVTDQNPFLNGVCKVVTDLPPLKLLDVLQGIENDLGRIKILDKGPRNIDLDILLYDHEQVSHERLQIPHKLMHEREFVLRPLAELIPTQRLHPPFDSPSILTNLQHIEGSTTGPRPLTVSTLSQYMPLMKPMDPTRTTRVMAVLNLTPDSFSDGGVHSSTDISAIESTVRRFIADGATIIDVGGQSTRPQAESITADEELARIIPAIKKIRSMPEAQGVGISVDTFLADVADKAIAAGADIINDISAGVLDPKMLGTMAKLQKTVILMHMRGDPQTMSKLTHYPNGVVEDVGRELLERVKAAEDAGIPRWRIIVDPGIGFAKNQEQNLTLLRNFSNLRAYRGLQGLPWLVGTSRKKFIGTVTSVKKAGERHWGTAAAVTASIKGGADIVRVHDVAEMSQVAKMADAIYRVNDDS